MLQETIKVSLIVYLQKVTHHLILNYLLTGMPIVPTFPRLLSAALQFIEEQVNSAYYTTFPRKLFERLLVLKTLSFSFVVQTSL